MHCSASAPAERPIERLRSENYKRYMAINAIAAICAIGDECIACLCDSNNYIFDMHWQIACVCTQLNIYKELHRYIQYIHISYHIGTTTSLTLTIEIQRAQTKKVLCKFCQANRK